jgi:wyosine [tRNA(Phe)-imidazoG37] synthetase (radical SAM superfamily)
MADKDYTDPKGYFVCPEGSIRRVSDEGGRQDVIVMKTDACSEAEWKRICEALISVKPTLTTASRTLPQFHIDHNRVIIS